MAIDILSILKIIITCLLGVAFLCMLTLMCTSDRIGEWRNTLFVIAMVCYGLALGGVAIWGCFYAGN